MLKYKNTIKLKLEKKLQEDKPCQIINFKKPKGFKTTIKLQHTFL